jgi:hypothetical protein
MTKLNIRKNTGKLLRHAASQVENLSDNTPKAAVRNLRTKLADVIRPKGSVYDANYNQRATTTSHSICT